MELAIIALYLIAIFGVGIYCNKFNNNIDDYLLAGRRLGVGLTTFTLVATYFGGGYVIGVGMDVLTIDFTWLSDSGFRRVAGRKETIHLPYRQFQEKLEESRGLGGAGVGMLSVDE